ncbi:Rieske (2Fe-2S) protein [Streptomyces sp. HUAS 31]|uniref:Cytochrome bc1 complex Rieske iron-sulfur subunit n=2 Tax=Streptomyces TaxID=1883 RepID=A0A7H8THU2_STRCX|nr:MULTISPECIES: Rieske (2Fe-2S) protein [Streptomyces]QWA21253.1 Rieske (2Fe-2S) protein [Streptomyces sp. JCM17656]QKZ23079.1 Rieske (2Fe-2S) protein [Streptomyces chartreusis]RSN88463.1 Rieske (2Fe-2S) protein [Streptomyces sp. WAC 05379]WCD95368.1 Rieske (2Fe-2S) protein [Streptomyces sp. HUAS 31]WSZ71164.1 Rieske (2Fe-2S) protein [Streptomyces chartreusis]
MTSEFVQPVSGPSRRTVVAAVGAAGLAAALTACGSDDGASDSSTEQGAAGGGATTESGGGSSADAGAGGAALAKTADIPEGSGKVFSDEKVVVSQPAAGDFKAFSTICTHQNCPMTDLKEDTLSCACHGSQFSVLDGSVKKGPATQPLAAKQISVSGDSITLA